MSNTLKFEALPDYDPRKLTKSLDGAAIDTTIFMLPAELGSNTIDVKVVKNSANIDGNNVNGQPGNKQPLGDVTVYVQTTVHDKTLEDNVYEK